MEIIAEVWARIERHFDLLIGAGLTLALTSMADRRAAKREAGQHERSRDAAKADRLRGAYTQMIDYCHRALDAASGASSAPNVPSSIAKMRHAVDEISQSREGIRAVTVHLLLEDAETAEACVKLAEAMTQYVGIKMQQAEDLRSVDPTQDVKPAREQFERALANATEAARRKLAQLG